MPVTEIEERVARLEGRMDEHSRFFESISVKLTLLEDKGDRNKEDLEKRIDGIRNDLEKKIDGVRDDLEKKVDGVRNDLEKKIDGVRNDLEKKIDTLRREMYTNFRWIVGIQLTTWITVLLAILFK